MIYHEYHESHIDKLQQYQKKQAITAVIFNIKRVEKRLLWESENIIMELARVDENIIAKIKYLSVILDTSICFFVDR